MPLRLLALLVLPLFLLPAASKKTVATAKGENQELILTVTLYIDPAEIKQMLGSDLDGHYVVASVTVQPKYGKEVTVERDDFELRAADSGEKSKPFVASQIAGRAAIVITQGQNGNAKMTGAGEKENPLEKTLAAKTLPDTKTDQPVSGLLYFAMEKMKLKDLEIYYGGKENRIVLRFK